MWCVNPTADRRDSLGEKEAQLSVDRVRDELVVVRCQLGERDAFDELVERWHRPLASFVRTRSADHATIDDSVQDIWTQVLRGLPGLRDPGRFPAWLFTIARRTLADDVRRRVRRVRVVAPVGPTDIDPADDVDDIAALLDRVTVARGLDGLEPREREAVELFHLADLSIADVALVLGVPPGTVKSRLHRARGQLREHLPPADSDQQEASP